MSDINSTTNTKQKRCLFCKKILVQNKGFRCLRCKLEGRKIVGKLVKGGKKIAPIVGLVIIGKKTGFFDGDNGPENME